MKCSGEKHASGLLKIAVRRMAKTYPFHANLLLPERFVCAPEVGTIGVTIQDARLQFWYAPKFVCSFDFDELIGVLHHEINHVLFEHLLARPEEFPDRGSRIIAEEITVNEWVVEPLPGNAIELEQYPALPPLEDTETRYARLANNSAHNGQESDQSGPKTVLPGPNSVQPVQKTTSKDRKNGAADGDIGISPLDNHDIWEHARLHPRVGKLVISAAVRQARDAMNHRERNKMPHRLGEQIDDIVGDARSAGLKEVIHSGSRGTVNWKRILRQFLAMTFQRRPALHRVPRRFPELIGVIPGTSQCAARPKVMAVIDTSASMTSDLLAQIDGELRHVACDCEVMIVECDCEIQRVYRFAGELAEVQGRGGTDMRPPFESDVLKRIRPDVIICFTDGGGAVPEMPPRVPTIWCLPPFCENPAGWGRVIYIEPA